MSSRASGKRAAAKAGAFAAVLLFVAQASVAWADFASGLAAYDAGRYREAAAAWRPLAEAGDPLALISLAELYARGQGVALDHAESRKLYRLAAQAGLAIAQANLGQLLEEGRGGSRDLSDALAWYSLAASQGQAWAAGRRDALAARLSEAQRKKAERLLSAYRKDFPALR